MTQNSSKLQINEQWCKGCGICVALCPKSVLSLKMTKVQVDKESSCIQCGMCEKLCPDYAISIAPKES